MKRTNNTISTGLKDGINFNSFIIYYECIFLQLNKNYPKPTRNEYKQNVRNTIV